MAAATRLTRRAVLAGTAMALVAGTAKAETPETVKWSTGTEKPKTKAPPNATDCHFHTYDSHYPMAPGATLKPADALPEDYRALQRRLGTTRGVIITPSTYGTDNALQLHSMNELGKDNFRVVGVVAEDVSDAELHRLNDLGVRGVRFNLAYPGPLTLQSLEKLSPRFAAIGWHCQINMKPAQLIAAEDILMKLPSGIVFDHLGQVPEPEGVTSPAYQLILKLIDRGNTWVKLSGAYITSKQPDYSDAGALMTAYVKAVPERMVWGSDWPHPSEPVTHKPDDAQLFDLMANAMPNEATLHRVLVDNPAQLYGFPK